MKKRVLAGVKSGASIWALGLAIIAWELFVVWRDIPPFLLPRPSAVLSRLVEERAFFFNHAFATFRATVGGFVLASSFAFISAIILVKSATLESFMFPYLVSLKVIPIIAIAPLLAIWIGYDIKTRIIVAALIGFFPVVVNTLVGLKSPSADMLALMRSYSASELDILLKIRIPNALPFIFSGLRVIAPTSLIGALVAEMMASDEGLGYVLLVARGYVNTEYVFCCVFLTAFMGFSLFWLVVFVEKKMLKWHESQLVA